MAALVCWASGLLDIMTNKEADAIEPGGPVVLITGTAGRLNSLRSGHGEFVAKEKAFYAPGSHSVDNQHDRMALVIDFGDKLHMQGLSRREREQLQRARAQQREAQQEEA